MTEGGPAAVSPSAWSSSARPGVPTGGEFVRVVVPGSRPSHGRASCVRPAAVLSAWSSRACPGISGDPGVATGGDSVRGGRLGPVPGSPAVPVLPPAAVPFGWSSRACPGDLRRSHGRRLRPRERRCRDRSSIMGTHGGFRVATRDRRGFPPSGGDVEIAAPTARVVRRPPRDPARLPGSHDSPTCGDTVEQSKASVPSPISNWSCLRVLSDPEATDDQDALS